MSKYFHEGDTDCSPKDASQEHISFTTAVL